MKVKELRSRFTLGLTLAIVIMVITSPILVLVNPTQVSAATTINDSKSNRIDSSGYHSTPGIPPPVASSPLSSQTPMVPAATNQESDGDFSTQAALSLTRAAQTNNFVASKAYYDVSFRTATAGVIKSVVMDFPPGTSVGSALVVEATGIGPGTLAASAGEVLTYTVTNAVNVPALTNIRIQISNINNPPTPSTSFTVSITTRNAANGVIDGPTPTSAYNMVQVGNAQIAPGAVTTTKIATGAVTTGDIADGAVTGNKIAGTQKLLFAQCTLTSGTLAGGQGGFFTCNVPGAQPGDLVVAEYLGEPNIAVWTNLIAQAASVQSADTVLLFLRNDGTGAITVDGQSFSLIVFRK